MGSVRVAIVGVGNCASSLVQGVEYYKDADPAIRVPGLMHVTFGPYPACAGAGLTGPAESFDVGAAWRSCHNTTINARTARASVGFRQIWPDGLRGRDHGRPAHDGDQQ